MTFTIDDAVAIAAKAHDGQLDKAGKPYISHPLRVMDRVRTEHERMAAVLHDVIEDTPVTADDLAAAGAPPEVVAAVVALSKSPGEPMANYLARVAADPIAAVVKRADIADNASPARIDCLDGPTQERLRAKYEASLRMLDELERA